MLHMSHRFKIVYRSYAVIKSYIGMTERNGSNHQYSILDKFVCDFLFPIINTKLFAPYLYYLSYLIIPKNFDVH